MITDVTDKGTKKMGALRISPADLIIIVWPHFQDLSPSPQEQQTS